MSSESLKTGFRRKNDFEDETVENGEAASEEEEEEELNSIAADEEKVVVGGQNADPNDGRKRDDLSLENILEIRQSVPKSKHRLCPI